MKDLKRSVQIENVLLVRTNTHAGKYSGKKKRKGKEKMIPSIRLNISYKQCLVS